LKRDDRHLSARRGAERVDPGGGLRQRLPDETSPSGRADDAGLAARLDSLGAFGREDEARGDAAVVPVASVHFEDRHVAVGDVARDAPAFIADADELSGAHGLEALEPWAELDWIGREITLGGARLKVIEPVVRCNLTKTNPETGVRDADTLGALEAGWGHKNFGVYCQVIEGGSVAEGDSAGLVS
jgi:hypothetical protein